MPAKIRILIVEDKIVWANFLEKRYHFEVAEILDIDRNFVDVERASTFDEASEKIKAARREPYDLVSLDINLSNPNSEQPQQDGLHLLGEIAKFQSAWMVAILTGVEKDSTFTGSRANVVRRNLRNLAMQTFPPERLVVIEKPSELTALEDTADMPTILSESAVLGNRIKQVVSIFEHTSSYRNVFRKLILPNEYKENVKDKDAHDLEDDELSDEADASQEGKAKRQKKEWKKGEVIHWQVRFDCGEMITIPQDNTIEMDVIRVLLENPRKEFSYGALEAAAMGETALSREDLIAQGQQKAPRLDDRTQCEQIAAALEGPQAEEVGGGAGAGADMQAAANEMVQAGHGQVQDGNFDDTERQSRETYERELRKLQAKIDGLKDKPESDGTVARMRNEAAALKKEIGKLRRGGRTAESTRIAAHKSRAFATLREQGLVDLANHLSDCIEAKGTIHYWPPADRNWQTE